MRRTPAWLPVACVLAACSHDFGFLDPANLRDAARRPVDVGADRSTARDVGDTEPIAPTDVGTAPHDARGGEIGSPDAGVDVADIADAAPDTSRPPECVHRCCDGADVAVETSDADRCLEAPACTSHRGMSYVTLRGVRARYGDCAIGSDGGIRADVTCGVQCRPWQAIVWQWNECLCVCGSYRRDCNGRGNGDDGDGCEADFRSDPSNCGGCGRACDPGQRCVMSRCID